MGSGKTPLISTVAASICIIIYIAALVFGAIQITLSINSRRALAEQEFNDLADRASAASILGFMSPAYQEVLMDKILESKTIVGAIVSGSDGQYGFERREGSVISWVGNSPRFKSGFGLPSDPYRKGINITGQRNGNIQVQYSLIDYDAFVKALKSSMTVILAALAFAILVLIIEILMKKRSPVVHSTSSEPLTYTMAPVITPDTTPVIEKEPEIINPIPPEEEIPENEIPEPAPQEDRNPQGLFSSRSSVGWESYTQERLASELHRCAASEQDLVFLCIDCRDENNPLSETSVYRELAHETVKFFGLRDLIFEMGEYGLSVIIPDDDLEQGIMKSEEFLKRIKSRISGASDAGFCIGLSSRAGRLVEPERLMFESREALIRAKDDPSSPIIGFRSDPEKYRKFISER